MDDRESTFVVHSLLPKYDIYIIIKSVKRVKLHFFIIKCDCYIYIKINNTAKSARGKEALDHIDVLGKGGGIASFLRAGPVWRGCHSSVALGRRGSTSE